MYYLKRFEDMALNDCNGDFYCECERHTADRQLRWDFIKDVNEETKAHIRCGATYDQAMTR